MAQNAQDDRVSSFLSFPSDWLAYLRGPRRFLASKELQSASTVKSARDSFFVGMAGVTAFSAANLNFSPYDTEENAKLFQGTVLITALLVSNLVFAFLVHILARLVRGRGTFRETVVVIAFTLAFLWPATTLFMIAVSRFAEATLGISWTALMPYVTDLTGYVAPTVGTILLGAFTVSLGLWWIAYMIYGYSCAVSVAHKLSLPRSLFVVGVGLGLINLFNTPLTEMSYFVAKGADPILGWLFKLI
ncbi:MAG: hypothetical protein KGJ66_07180 [Alphaproteobacteria bacterium]|nr:hypothetical protein [Alphaproteobacteria bacterium]